MDTHSHKTAQEQSRAVANNISLKRGDQDALESAFVDNRPQIQRQKQLQQMADNSRRGQILSQRSPVVQRLVQIHEVHDIHERIGKGPAPITDVQAQTEFKNLALRELDLIDPGIRAKIRAGGELKIIWEEGYSPIQQSPATDFTDYGKLEEFRKGINRSLDLIKAKVLQTPKLSLPKAKIGNEFTFTNEDLKTFHDTFKPKSKPKNKDDWKHAYRLALEAGPFTKSLGEWQDKMAAFGFAPIAGTDKYGFKKHRYAFPQIDWYYDVTVDDACIEIITPPAKAEDIEKGEIALAMDNYIFGVAARSGLIPDVKVGGGHINIDRATGIEGEGRSLLNFLNSFFADAAYWKQLDPDKINAPFPDEVNLTEKLKQVLDEVQGQIQLDRAVAGTDLATRLVKEVFVKNLAGEPERASPHYQALNLEHYNEANQEEQRLEVRRVPAQTSRIQLLNQLDRIFALLKGERPPAIGRFG